MYIPNPLQCYACFKYGHHKRACKLYGGDELCRRCGIKGITYDESRCTNEVKCVNCGEAHPSTSRICKTWKKEKEVVTIKYREGLSFPEARKIVEARHNLSFSTVLKTNNTSSVELKNAQTQTNDASVQTITQQKPIESNVKTSQKTITNKKPDKPLPKSPRSPKKLKIRSSQTAFQRGLMTKYNSINASRVLMKTWKRIQTMQNKIQISKVPSSN